MKKHNFYAGPSILSQYTIKNTADAIINFADMGLSILEISHRSKQFQAVMDEAEALAIRFGVMSIPTIIAFRNGAEIARNVGLAGKQKLLDMISE